MKTGNFTESDVEQWLEDERSYLESPPQVNDEVTQAVEYLQLLQRLEKAQ
jgi:hypothetical protein